jgi:N-acetylmuramoyl-L-alanine amidase
MNDSSKNQHCDRTEPMKIALDIGHARGTGARGNGFEEHAIATSIVDHLFTELKDKGHDVHVIDFPDMSNTGDLNATIRAANSGGYDFGISIHCDSAQKRRRKVDEDKLIEIITTPDPAPHGAHVCFFPSSSRGRKLAQCIAEYLTGILPGRADAIQERSNLAILKKTKPVWVLCECGFITNPGDADVMKHHPESIANSIALGVEDYCKG